MLTGHILWISHGKKKQVVYDFIEHVGLEWMDKGEAVAGHELRLQEASGKVPYPAGL